MHSANDFTVASPQGNNRYILNGYISTSPVNGIAILAQAKELAQKTTLR